MGKSKTNLLTKGYSGKVGDQFVLRRINGQSIMASKPEDMNHPATPAQIAARKRFLEAARYAKRITSSPERKAAYEANALPGQSAYTRAMADFFKKPWIDGIDVNFYKGQAGDTIRVMAYDDFMVTRVIVTLKGANGEELETGSCVAVSTEASEGWIYTATTAQPIRTGITIEVLAYDLPGNFVLGTYPL